jgi:transcription termination factor Rho
MISGQPRPYEGRNPLSETTEVTADVTGGGTAAEAAVAERAGTTRRRRAGGGLASMLLPELQSLAASLGISGTARMRKGELVAAIQERQAATAARSEVAAASPRTEARAEAREDRPAAVATAPANEPVARVAEQPAGTAEAPERTRRASRPAGPPEPRPASDVRAASGAPTTAEPAPATEERPVRERGQHDRGQSERGERRDSRDQGRDDRSGREQGRDQGRDDRGGREQGRDGREQGRDGREQGRDGREQGRDGRDQNRDGRDNRDQGARDSRDQGRDQNRDQNRDDDEDGEGGRRGRRSRFRDRRRGRNERGSGGETTNEPQVAEDDVLVPVAGILDVVRKDNGNKSDGADNYAFIRTTGYLSGANDVYVAMNQVKRYGLRRGDAVTGAVRQPREGEARRERYNPLIRLDTINGMDPEEARRRPEFYKLTPLYPQERLRLETEPHILTTRVIDLVMPIGKGQRALIVSPPKAGKTMVLQAIANAITRNNPECHLMVVLVDERPEEVTDMQRSVKGEVIASTFDRPPQDHTTVAELAIERAKRLVELGHDVVVLLDSITRLGRAYNLAAPASGRILSGGIDSTALYPPKRFLGAARNIENGGSLTILATALVETGSMMDTVIFEEFKGTGNAELKLDRKIADKRVWPAIDIDPSGTRKEEILMAPDELGIVIKLRRVLHALDSQEALNVLLERLKKTRTNIEFLMQIAQTTPGE